MFLRVVTPECPPSSVPKENRWQGNLGVPPAYRVSEGSAVTFWSARVRSIKVTHVLISLWGDTVSQNSPFHGL